MDCTTEELDMLFEALANQHRRDIIYTLSLRPASISMLAKRQGLSLPAIYKHIKILEEVGLIQRRKSGRVNFLALNASRLRLVQNWLGQYHTYWSSGGKESLDNYVDGIEQQEKE